MLLVVVLATATALSGGFIAGVVAGLALAQARRDAGGIAPHEALRPLYPVDTKSVSIRTRQADGTLGEWGWP